MREILMAIAYSTSNRSQWNPCGLRLHLRGHETMPSQSRGHATHSSWIRTMKPITLLLVVVILTGIASPGYGQLVISGNENKIDLSRGAQQTVPGAKPDSLTFLNFSTFPPAVQHVSGVSNTVIGPPSNVAITPDGRVALVADSLKIDPHDPEKTVPANRIHIVDLTTNPPKVVGSCTAGQQPSGMSITSNGKQALVAHRADGTVSVLSIDGLNVRQGQQVKVFEKDEN